MEFRNERNRRKRSAKVHRIQSAENGRASRGHPTNNRQQRTTKRDGRLSNNSRHSDDRGCLTAAALRALRALTKSTDALPRGGSAPKVITAQTQPHQLCSLRSLADHQTNLEQAAHALRALRRGAAAPLQCAGGGKPRPPTPSPFVASLLGLPPPSALPREGSAPFCFWWQCALMVLPHQVGDLFRR